MKVESASGWVGGLAMLATLLMSPAARGNEPGALPKPLDIRVIQSGHSLTDPIPEKLIVMLRASGVSTPVVARSTIPGSPMDWRWNNPATPDARAGIGNYDLLVLTERVPLSNTVPYHDSGENALKWFTHAWTEGRGGKGAETVLYATWVSIDSGPDAENPYKDPEGNIPWRERLPLEMARWEAIADEVNERRPEGAPAMRIIPGPLIMAAIDEAITDGTAPGLKKLSDLFIDEVHINSRGAYLIALAHFAVIYGRDPRALPDRVDPHDPQPELAAFMQDLVWRVVTDYEKAGLQSVEAVD